MDFVMKMRAEDYDKIKFVLMSGIFTDKAFIKESLDQTGAVTFIEKKLPFDAKTYTAVIQVLKGDSETAEAGRLNVETQPFDPVRLVQDLALLDKPHAAAKGLELAVHIDPLLREYGWAEREQVGAAEYTERYLRPAGREDLTVSDIEHFVYAEKL